MNRRPWTMAVLLVAVAVTTTTGCATKPEPDTNQLAGQLAAVKADRDHLAALVKQLATTSATLEAYAVNNRQGCLNTLKAVRRRIIDARASLGDGKVDGKQVARQLAAARRSLDDALDKDCAPAAP
jgi:hypothetical protein